MEQITVVSDTHRINKYEVNSRNLFPGFFDQLKGKEREEAYNRFAEILEIYQESLLSRLYEGSGRKLLIHLGDVTCGFQERGIGFPKMEALTRNTISQLKEFAPMVLIAWGNHDTGYDGNEGNLTLKSLYTCRDISPLWWKHEVDNVLFVGVCSPLFASNYGNEQREIERLQQDQVDFVAETLRSKPKKQRWVLCTHDLALGALLETVGREHQKTLTTVLMGDVHSPLAGKIIKLKGFLQPLGLMAAIRRKTVVCPSVAPLWWEGCALLSGSVQGDTTHFQQQQFFLPLGTKEKMREFPFSSFSKALIWMLTSHAKRMLKKHFRK